MIYCKTPFGMIHYACKMHVKYCLQTLRENTLEYKDVIEDWEAFLEGNKFVNDQATSTMILEMALAFLEQSQ